MLQANFIKVNTQFHSWTERKGLRFSIKNGNVSGTGPPSTPHPPVPRTLSSRLDLTRERIGQAAPATSPTSEGITAPNLKPTHTIIALQDSPAEVNEREPNDERS